MYLDRIDTFLYVIICYSCLLDFLNHRHSVFGYQHNIVDAVRNGTEEEQLNPLILSHEPYQIGIFHLEQGNNM